MQAIYDVIGSILIGGIVLLMLLQFNSSVMEGAAVQTFNSVVQSNITAVGELIEYDFRKMGYRVPVLADSSIVYADSLRITFKGDIDNNGTLERVTYAFNPALKSNHQNPKARVLTRTINGTASQNIDLGITRFRMKFYDRNKTLLAASPVPAPSKIAVIEILMDMESTAPYDGKYQGCTWQRTLVPKNLK